MIARAARDQYQLERVLFVPAYLPPHKSGQKALTAPQHRYRMVELAIQDDSQFEISDFELNSGNVSYTYETLQHFRHHYPEGTRLFFILGADSLKTFSTWHKAEGIKKLAHLLIAPRVGLSKKELNQNDVSWIDMPVVNISSTDVRKLIRKKSDVSEEIVPEPVKNYVRDNDLYLNG